MHILGLRESAETLNAATGFLDCKLPKPSEPIIFKNPFAPKSKDPIQSIHCGRYLPYDCYDFNVPYGYTAHDYRHFSHSRSNSVHLESNIAPTNILIIGATGIIGNYITRAIIDAHSQGHFSRICIYTSERTIIEKCRDIAALESLGVEVWVGNLDDEKKFKEACKGIDTIVSCVGRSAIEKQIPLITWAEEANVRRFFPSEYGTDIEYFPNSVHEPPHQMKLKVRGHMKTMKRLEHTYLVTGPYSDLYFGAMKERPEVGGFDVKKRRACLLGDGDGPVSFTAMNDVGKFVVAALINFHASRNTTLVVHSFTATPREIMAEHEAQTKQKWNVRHTSMDSLKSMEKQAYQIYSPLATVLTLRRIWTEGGTLYKIYDDTLLGYVETETLEDQVRLNIMKQTGVVPPGESLLRTLSAV